jgi:amidase
MQVLHRPATAIANDIRNGAYSSRELVESCIRRIEELDSNINAVVSRRFEAALEEAVTADAQRAAGRTLGQLHGVPITVKDSFDVRGLATTFGRPEFAAHRATQDAVTITRLVAAGAIVLGKTNVPKDLGDWQTFNEVYGTTRNPWDLRRSPGGSSGGSAAALAAGFSALELGSDIAGSIRVPASFCGVWGHKPTFGVVPMRGHGKVEWGAQTDILVAGPLARSAADLELAFGVIAGPDELENPGWQLSLPGEIRSRLGEFKFAIVADDRDFPVDGAIRNSLGELARALTAEGAAVDVEPELPIESRAGYELFIALLRAATSARYTAEEMATLRDRAQEFSAEDRSYDALMHRGLTMSHREWHDFNDRRGALKHRWRAFFQRYDALICPVATTTAFPSMIGVPKIHQLFDVDGAKRPASDTYYWIGMPSLSHLPATAVPIGETEAGLPVGAQIVCAEFGDKRCLRIARLVEQAFRGFIPPPETAPRG